MATFGIESNGRLEKTAIYFNGEQLGGIKEVLLSLDEDGTFDAVIQYEGVDKNLYIKQIFSDYLENIKVVEPTFTEEEAEELQLLVIESNGDIEETGVFINDEEQLGIINLYVHIKSAQSKNGLKSFFMGRRDLPEHPEFQAEITYRNDDDTTDTERIF